MRSKQRFKVHEYFETNRIELVNMWLDSEKSWDEVKIKVDRLHENTNEASKGFISVKGRDIKKEYGDVKGQQIIDARKESGLFYKDDDFPDDSDDSWHLHK